MTEAQFLEKYGEVKVKFARYYKYTFTFKAMLPDGAILSCCAGGSGEDIYRYEVIADCEESVYDLGPYSGTVSKDGNIIASFDAN